MEYITRLTSSLEKCFLTDPIGKFENVGTVSTLQNQPISLQYVTTMHKTDAGLYYRLLGRLEIEGDLRDCVTLRRVEQVPNPFPVYENAKDLDPNYLSFEPGLYPDLLTPMQYGGDKVEMVLDQLRAFWVDITPRGKFPAGDHKLTFRLWHSYDKDGEVAWENVSEQTVTVHVIPADAGDPGMCVTQWFHCDCLAEYYGVEVFSERHWEIIENFARTAVKNGINLLLTPIFTPPLDTAVGGERTTVQLVGVKKDKGVYSFDYTLLDRWIAMCDRIGIRYFEISHLFTQWGAGHAPKVMATVDGEYRRIFGWDTDATGDEYTAFLRTFLPDFLAHMKARGDDTRCFFHVSDEPSREHLEQYGKSKAVVADILAEYPIMDALSDFDFWKEGVVKTPIPANSAIQPFLDAHVPNLWTYYCCGQYLGVSNRLMAMPSWRTRFIGAQFYKYDIKGFLQWGYNFYRNDKSVDAVNPYYDTCGDSWVPGGDCFSVYPAGDGTALESLRIIVFREALDDVAAMKLAESLCGREAVIAAMEAVVGEIRFDRCVDNARDLLRMREAVNRLIETHLA